MGTNAMAPDVLVNGFVGIGKNWGFLDAHHHGPYNIPRNPLVGKMMDYCTKGLRNLKGKRVFGMKLTKRHGLRIFLLVSVDTSDVERTILRKTYAEAVKETLQLMKLTDTAKKVLTCECSSNTCVKRLYGCHKCGIKTIELLSLDIEEFGRNFMAIFNSNLSNYYNDVKIWLCGIDLGPLNITIQSYCEKTMALKMETLEEVALYVVNKFQSPLDYVYMWRIARASNELIAGKDRVTTFYPLFLGTVGNHVIEPVVQESEYNNNNNEPTRVFMKLSCDTLQSVHFMTPVQLQQTLLSDSMWRNVKGHLQVAQMELGFANKIRHAIERERRRRRNIARCEIIFSMLMPKSDWSAKIMSSNTAQITSWKMLFERIELAKLLYHLEDTFIPLVNTLERLLRHNIEWQSFRPSHIESLEDIRLASICQCMLVWGIHGGAEWSWTQYTGIFPGEIKQLLGLQEATKLTEGVLFRKLDLIPHMIVVKSAKRNDSRKFIAYDGPWIAFTSCLLRLQQYVGGDDHLRHIFNSLEQISAHRDHAEVAKVHLAESFWTILTKLAYQNRLHHRGSTNLVGVANIQEIANATTAESMAAHPFSTARFIRWCCNDKASRSTVKAFLSCVEHVHHSQISFEKWKMELSQRIETQLYGTKKEALVCGPS